MEDKLEEEEGVTPVGKLEIGINDTEEADTFDVDAREDPKLEAALFQFMSREKSCCESFSSCSDCFAKSIRNGARCRCFVS